MNKIYRLPTPIGGRIKRVKLEKLLKYCMVFIVLTSSQL